MNKNKRGIAMQKTMQKTTPRMVLALGVATLTAMGACSQGTKEWPLERDIAPLVQQELQLTVGMSFDGSRSKVAKVEITDIKCNYLAKGRVGCSYKVKATIHKYARGASSPVIRVFEEKSTGSFARSGDTWSRD